MPYTGVTSLAAKQVCLGLEKRATCTDFLTLYFLLQIFATCNNLICCQTGLKVASWTRIRSTATLQNNLHVFVARLPYLSVSRLRHRYALTKKAWEDAIHRLGNKMATAASYCTNCHWDVSWESCNVDNWEQRHGPWEGTKLFASSCSVRHVNHLLAFFIRCSFWSSCISSLLLNFYELLNIVSV